MNDRYCHLCDADPCHCGQQGRVTFVEKKVAAERGGPRGLDAAVREFVLSTHDAGARETYGGWLDRIHEQFGTEGTRDVWNRVSNELQREWRLISHPNVEGPLNAPSAFPEVRKLPLAEATAEVERLIDSGGWVVGEPGLRLWKVVTRIQNVVYISTYDALHDMNRRNYRVTTKSPGGNPTQYWYVKE